ncbi:hypothetical protein CgunFtcFv8_018691 [Champsocephalus gunnari]|uniref:WW domain-binding protein 4 n=1 Tax=Champsocephalus gunnari TaxID=52237 RepID=A0AAN8GTG6_CHAGU|nr:hypothetical protein CgunFtcFv8_018691 [Champsocephalus gunnari]
MIVWFIFRTEYWKSQPRKFCQYCKCWIADNKPSVEFHERGKNHKENVAAKITEIKKKSMDNAKQEERMSKDFQKMEEAAMKAYQEDLKRIEKESGGSGVPVETTTQEETPPVINQARSMVGPQARPKVGPQGGPQGGSQGGSQGGPQGGYQSGPQGGPQSKKQQKKQKANQMPRGQMRAQVWVKGQAEDGNAYYYNTITGESRWDNPESFQGANSAPAQPERSSGGLWTEAVSPEGHKYYYNSETRESSWEKPAGFTSGSQEEAPQPEPPGVEESSSGVPASQEPGVPEQALQQPQHPQISFRKRKAEAEPLEKEGLDKESEDAPKGEAEEMVKEEVKKEEDVQSTAAAPEEKKEEAPVKIQIRIRQKSANPYGAWEQIKEEVDPYSKVDLQLPKVEGYTASAPASRPPPEPKTKFKERVITSLGEEGGSTSFRKNKTQNGKSRSIRQREEDDDD